MELTSKLDFNTFITIALLLLLMVSLILLMKYIAGDFSPVKIEEIGKDEIEIKNSNGIVIGKKIIVSYKHTYKDGRTKVKIKTIQ